MNTQPAPQLPSLISFCSTSKPPYHLLSNFYGGPELHYMADRVDHPAVKEFILHNIATCTPSQFITYFRALYPSGNPSRYILTAQDGRKLLARGILARLVGLAAISTSPTAKRRMNIVRRLAGLKPNVPIATNTHRILSDAGLSTNSSKAAQTRAIDTYNQCLMQQCLERKFRPGHFSDDGIEFRQLLLDTGNARLKERAFGRGNRWSGKANDDGLLGQMLVSLRTQLATSSPSTDS